MIDIDTRQIAQLESKLRRLNTRGLRFAEVETINRAAFATMKESRQNVEQQMTLRNKWTQRSIRVQKATMSRSEAEVGSIAPHMETQEIGASEDAQGKHGVAIPTSVSSGEGRGRAPRQRLVRRPNKVSSIQLAKNKRFASRKQRNAVAVKQAIRTGRRFIFLELQRRKGLFRVYGGKRNPRIEMMHDLTRRRVTIPRNPWLMPAAQHQAQQLPRYYAQALQRQLARLR